MKVLALLVLFSFYVSAEEYKLDAIFGNNNFLNKEIELIGYLAAAPTLGSENIKEGDPLPIMYFYASEQAFNNKDKKKLFFDWSSKYCIESFCGKYLNKTLIVRGEISYIKEPINFHSLTNITNIEVLVD